MPYYETLQEDIDRAKQILAEGRAEAPGIPELEGWKMGGTIYGKDTFAAYQLLASFVEVIEVIGVDVCKVAMRVHGLK
jgi:hypothetical protein